MTYESILERALLSYGLGGAPVTRLGGADNTNFRVDTPEQSYVLRLRTSGRLDEGMVASELAWLSRLKSDTPLTLPEPVANLEGELVTRVSTGGDAALCTLITWMEGSIPPTVDALTPNQLSDMGALMARLHLHARRLDLPKAFERPTYDEAHFRGRLEVLVTALERAAPKHVDLSDFRTQANHVISRFTELESAPEGYGLIHADFHSGNYLLSNDGVRIIDFDRCGFGFYLFDLALALMELGKEQRSFFLKGYGTVAPLPIDYQALLQTFLCLAYLDNLGFLAANPEEWTHILGELPFVVRAFREALEATS